MEKKAEKKAQTTNTSAEVAKVQTVNAEALALQKEIERKTKGVTKLPGRPHAQKEIERQPRRLYHSMRQPGRG